MLTRAEQETAEVFGKLGADWVEANFRKKMSVKTVLDKQPLILKDLTTMTSITDATGYTDQDNGHTDQTEQPLTNAPKTGANPETIPHNYLNYSCPHCDDGCYFAACECPLLTDLNSAAN